MNKIRHAGNLPGVRKVALQPRVRSAIAHTLMLRYVPAAWETTEPWALLRREYFSRGAVHEYRLSDGSGCVVIKHGRDFEAIREILHRGEYEPPAEVAARLGKGRLRVLDIGANVGVFSAWVLRSWPDAVITAFEPDPENAELYRRWSNTVRNAEKPKLLEAAAASADGTLTFHSGLGSASYVSHDGIGNRVKAVDAFDYLQKADFSKIDIEGGEWDILTDPRLADLGDMVIVIEYHRQHAPSLPARDAAEKCFADAGFSTGYGVSNYWGHGTLWAWKD